ncbi:hypothetical protein CBFG_00311 [Clostridiales bacterium 1_7_47FAA]|nr:hypothetical protein CBFG_00311 [Clostridiales bacterium 1_7_47FAA]
MCFAFTGKSSDLKNLRGFYIPMERILLAFGMLFT